MSENKNLFQKISAFRADLTKANWQPDKKNPAQGYEYVSEAKFKGNISPLLVKNGLESKISYDEYQVLEGVKSMSQHFKVRATLSLIDVETGESTDYVGYGEAADTGDKGTVKAQTSAFKALFANNFMVSAYESENDKEPVVGSKYVPEIVKIAAKEKLEGAKFTPKEAPKEVPKSETPAQSAPTSKPHNEIMYKAAQRVLDKLRVADPAKLIPYGSLDSIEAEFAAAFEAGDVETRKVYTKYKVVVA